MGCVCEGSAPHPPERTVVPIWDQKANRVRPGADGLNRHFESGMTDPRVLSARITGSFRLWRRSLDVGKVTGCSQSPQVRHSSSTLKELH